MKRYRSRRISQFARYGLKGHHVRTTNVYRGGTRL